MEDTANPSPEKPKKKIITVGEDRVSSSGSGGGSGERRGGKGRRGGRGRDEDDRKPAVPPALMRGPRPKPKAAEPEVVEAPEPEVAEEAAEGAVAEGEPTAEASDETSTATPA